MVALTRLGLQFALKVDGSHFLAAQQQVIDMFAALLDILFFQIFHNRIL